MRDEGGGLPPDHPEAEAHAVQLAPCRRGRGRDPQEFRCQGAVGVGRDQKSRFEIGAGGAQQSEAVGFGAGVGLLVRLDASHLVGLGGDRGEHAQPRPRGTGRGLVVLGQHVDRGLGVGREHPTRPPIGEQSRRPGVAILVRHGFRQHEVDDIVGVPRRVARALLGVDDVVRRRDQGAEPVGRAVPLPAERHDEVRGCHELSRRPTGGRSLDRPI